MERTFTILKPDTVKAGNTGRIIDRLLKEGFHIRAMKLIHLTKAQAEGFYYVHKERPFFSSLVEFMSEGPIVPMVLEADNAIEKLRKVMGATDPAKADAGTIRRGSPEYRGNAFMAPMDEYGGLQRSRFSTGSRSFKEARSLRQFGRVLIVMGGVIALIGLLMVFGSRLPFRIGRLPLDIIFSA